jgi:hypothetical protein
MEFHLIHQISRRALLETLLAGGTVPSLAESRADARLSVTRRVRFAWMFRRRRLTES